MHLAGKVAVITGGASGIGRGTGGAARGAGTDQARRLALVLLRQCDGRIVHGVRAFLPHMLECGSGYIVNTGSVAGLLALTGEGAPYIASKFAVVGLTEALALYCRPRGVGVSLLCPGSVATNLHETGRSIGMTPEREVAETAVAASVQGNREMTPEEIGEAVAEGVEQERFFILPDPFHLDMLAERTRDPNGFLEARLRAALL